MHGWVPGAATWDDFKRAHLGDMQINSPDIFAGFTAPPQPERLFAATVNRIHRDLLDATIMIAWSLGGLLAIELAARYTRPGTPLILLNSTPCFVTKDNWPHGLAGNQIEGLLKKCRQNREAPLAYFCGLAGMGAESSRTVIRSLKRVVAGQHADKAILASWLQILANLDLREQYKKLSGPVHILLGGGDRLVSLEIGRQLTELNAASRVTTLPGRGHASFIAKPAAVAAFVQHALV